MKRFSIAVLVSFLGLAGAANAEKIFDCELTAHTRFGWIPSIIIIIFDDNMQSARVIDGYIYEIYKEPIAVEMEQIGPNKYKLAWPVDGLMTGENQRENADYILRLDIGQMKARMTGYVDGFANVNRGSGECKPGKKK